MRTSGNAASLLSFIPVRMAARIRLLAGFVCLSIVCGVATAAPLPTNQQLLGWGEDVYQKTVASLQIKNSSLFAEFGVLSGGRGGGDSGFSYLWPASTQLRVDDALVHGGCSRTVDRAMDTGGGGDDFFIPASGPR